MSLVRQQIGGQPEPRRVFGGSFAAICPLLPQQAWLQGSVLIVERDGEVRQCDLATAARIKVRSVLPFINLSFEVLSAYPEPKSAPTRLVLMGPGWSTLTGQQARQLAQIVGSRTHDRSVTAMAREVVAGIGWQWTPRRSNRRWAGSLASTNKAIDSLLVCRCFSRVVELARDAMSHCLWRAEQMVNASTCLKIDVADDTVTLIDSD